MPNQYKCVVISGLPGAGKTTVSNELAKRLGWFRYSTGEFWKAAWRAKHPDGKVTFEEFWRSTTLQDNIEANNAMVEMARKGNVVIDCRFPAVFDSSTCLLVYLDASLETRAARMLANGRYKESLEEVKTILNSREEDEVLAGNSIQPGYDFRKPSNYHLCINSDMLSIEAEIEIIMRIVAPDNNKMPTSNSTL
jgi:cytidylate kinase